MSGEHTMSRLSESAINAGVQFGEQEKRGATVIGGAKQDVVDVVRSALPTYRFDQYLNYPALDRDRWQEYALLRLHRTLDDPEQKVYVAESEAGPVVLAARVSAWDKDHFGFSMGSLRCVVAPEDESSRSVIDSLMSTCIDDLRADGVRFVSARFHGDHMSLTHAAEAAGFRYYESVLWPIRQSRPGWTLEPSVRLMEDRDLEPLMGLAVGNSYVRGHFYCDSGFDHRVVDSMYAKWLETAFRNRQPVTVVDFEGQPVGFFVVAIDEALSQALGVRYGRLQSLVVDGRIRGQGLGATLFAGTLSSLEAAGVEQIDSGYATKNHVSARIHAKNRFFTVYDENTFHLWLDQ
jgi:N-acetylglutamate synthase-like GNAT family acetyltransferase